MGKLPQINNNESILHEATSQVVRAEAAHEKGEIPEIQLNMSFNSEEEAYA